MTLDSEKFKRAREEKHSYENIHNSIAREFGIYAQTLKSFDIGNNYMRNESNGDLTSNENAVTTEPQHLLNASASALSFFCSPTTENSISVKPLDSILTGREDYSQEFENIGRVLQKIIMNPCNDFHSHLKSAIKQLLLYGNTAMMISSKIPKQPKFQTIDFRELYIYRNDEGEITDIWREYCKREGKSDNRFSNDKWTQHWELNDLESFNPLKGDKLVKYRLYKKNELQEEDEISYWPISVTQLYPDPGYQYGSGLGILMLPHVQRLNAFKKMLFNAGHLQIQPPMQLLKEQIINNFIEKDPKNLQQLNHAFSYVFKPAQIIPVKNQEPVLFPMQQVNDLLPFQQFVAEELLAIRQHSYIDILQLSDLTANASVEEVNEKINRKIQILSPMVSSVNQLLDGIVKKVLFSLMASPKDYKSLDLIESSDDFRPIQIQYENHFSSLPAQKKSKALTDFAQRLFAMAQADPKVLHNIDMDKMVRDMANLDGLGYLLRSDIDKEELDQKFEQRQMMAQQNGV